MLAVPSVADLAEFSGRAEDSYSAFASQALVQATLLFSLMTGLTEYPSGDNDQQLAINAILEMADRIYLEQPYQLSKAGPFTSETIGSYSYSKGSAVLRARFGQTTGLLWWDLAMERLATVDVATIDSAAIQVIEPALRVDTTTGTVYLVGPADWRVTGPEPSGMWPDGFYDQADTTIG